MNIRLKKIMAALAAVSLMATSAIGLTDKNVANANTGSTNVIIHKYTSTDRAKVVETPHDGSVITNIAEKFGANARPVPNITYDYVKLTQEDEAKLNAVNSDGKQTKAQVSAILGAGKTWSTTPATNAQGETRVTLQNENVKYYFVENTPATLTGSKATAFMVDVPTYAADGRTLLTDIHVYPKAIPTDAPEVPRKFVTAKENFLDTQTQGQDVKWIVDQKIPVGIKDYKIFKLVDKLDERLNHKGLEHHTVTYDNGKALVKGTDYNLTYEESTRTLTLDFTKAGMAKLATAEGKLIDWTFITHINEKAEMGVNIPNKAKLVFDNNIGGNGEKETRVSEVWTGGKKFKKVNSARDGLEGAIFKLYSQQDLAVTENLSATTGTKSPKVGKHVVKWTDLMLKENEAAIVAGKFATDENGTKTSATNKPQVGSPVIMRSSADGTFEIMGLSGEQIDPLKGAVRNGLYSVEEIKAPSGYNLPVNNTWTFKITKGSHAEATAPIGINDGAGLIENKPRILPNTGGLGTTAVAAAGLMLILAGVAYRRRAQK